MVLAAIIGACAVTIVQLSIEVAQKLEALETARSDNVEWALSQAEVELLTLHAAILSAGPDDPREIERIRQRFNIFFSRVEMLDKGPIYGALATDPVYHMRLARVRDFLEGTVALIDGPDAALAGARQTLADRVERLHPEVRRLSLDGVARFAATADRQREAVAETLLRLAILVVLLVAGLAVLLGLLLRLYRLSQERAHRLEITSARLQTVVATALDAVLVADRDGRLRDINPAGEEIFGISREEAIGARFSEIIVPDLYRAAHDAGMRRYRRTGARRMIGAGRVQMTARRKSGDVFPAEISVQTAETEEGEVFVAFLRDISQRKKAESELRAARDRALAGEKAKAEFLAMMSHEMRTPLNGLIGTLALIRSTGLGPQQLRHVENMEASGQLLLSHINDVLDISRFEAGKVTLERKVFDPGAVVQEVVDSQRAVAAAGNNRFGWTWVGPPAARVRGDPAALRRTLVNLVGNALKFTREGTVSVEAERLGGTGAGARFEFRVTDTGIGIAEDRLPRIFDDFETHDGAYGRRTGGTGLGLGIARRMAEAMGGQIGAESEEGEGSLFWIRVPLEIVADAAMVEDDGPPEAGAPPRRRVAPKDILLVEDNRINREVLSEMLRLGGHRVTEAEDGTEGVRLAAERRFDVILMDISMPVIDGFEAARRIRSGVGASRAAPIVAVTAHAMPSEVARIREAGMNGHLIKPVSIAALDAQLAGVSGPSAPPEPAPAGESGGEAAAPLVDEARRAELAGQVGAAARARLEARFLAEAEALIATLERVGQGDLQATVGALHHLSGSAGIFGAERLRRQLHVMECAGKGGDGAALLSGRARLAAIWRETRAAYARLDASPAQDGGTERPEAGKAEAH